MPEAVTPDARAAALDVVGSTSAVVPTAGNWSVARDSLVYAVGSVVGKVAGVILLPVLTRIFSPADYGRLDLISTTGSALTTLLMLGLDAAVTRHLAGTRDADARRRLASTWVSMLVGLGLLAGLVLVTAAGPLAGAVFGTDAAGGSAPAGTVAGIALLAVVVLGGLLNAAALNLLRLLGRPGAYATLSGLSFVLNAVLALLLAGPAGLGIPGVVGAWAIAVSVTAVAGLAEARELLAPAIDREAAARLLRFGLPLVPALAVAWLGEVANRGILLGAAGAAEVGAYSVALRVASLVGLAGTAFILAWQPRAYAVADEPGGHPWIAGTSAGMVATLGGAALGLAAVSTLVVAVLSGPGFERAATMTGPLALAATATVLLTVLSVGSTIRHRSGDVAKAMTVGVLAGVALNVILAPRYGGAGTAWGVAAGQGTGLLVAATLASRRLVLPYRRAPLVALVAAVTAGVAALSATEPGIPGRAAGALVAAIIVVAGLALLAAQPDPAEADEAEATGTAAERAETNPAAASGAPGSGAPSSGAPSSGAPSSGAPGGTEADPTTAATTDTYRRYRSSGYAAKWNPGIRGNVLMGDERDAWLRDCLADAPRLAVLDLGCGDALLAQMLDANGLRPSAYTGVDLLPERVAAARAAVPWGTVLEADVRRLPLPDHSIDAAVALTLVSSLPGEDLRRAFAAEVRRVVRPGGRLLVYDLRLPSPRNRAVSPVSVATLRELFPGWTIRARLITLLPPIARSRLVGSAATYRALAAIPVLCSHVAVELTAPGTPAGRSAEAGARG